METGLMSTLLFSTGYNSQGPAQTEREGQQTLEVLVGEIPNDPQLFVCLLLNPN